MKKVKKKKWLLRIAIVSFIAVLLFSIWVIWTQKEYENYIDQLRERNPIFENRAIIGGLPVTFFEIKRILGGYSRNYGQAGYNLQLLCPKDKPYRSGPINYAIYQYFSDKEIDSINGNSTPTPKKTP